MTRQRLINIEIGIGVLVTQNASLLHFVGR